MLQKKYLLFMFPALALAAAPLRSGAQTLVNRGATITITTGATITVKGDVGNGSSGVIENAGTLTISGNTINDGAINAPSASSIILEGSSTQIITGASPVHAQDVVVNNPSGVVLVTPLTVDGTMTFSNGVIEATNMAAPVIFGPNGTVGGLPSDASHVNGYVQKAGTGVFTFPVGDAAKYQPVEMDIASNDNGITARYYGADAGVAPFGTRGSTPTPLLYYNTKEYWDLVPTGNASGTVTILFDDYNNSGIGNIADLRVAHLDGGEWLNEGGTASGAIGSGSITSGNITSFSPFTLGSVSPATPLPVSLLAFSGSVDGNANRLDWQTAAESAGTTFTVERSGNGSAFEPIGTVSGKGGNSTYIFHDRQPLAPVAYYRLKTQNPGGASRYSQTVMMRREGASTAQVAVYPVPATSTLVINSTGSSLTGSTATILDAQGKTMTNIQLEGLNQVDINAWPAGIYTLRLADGTAMRVIKK